MLRHVHQLAARGQIQDFARQVGDAAGARRAERQLAGLFRGQGNEFGQILRGQGRVAGEDQRALAAAGVGLEVVAGA
ncbi:hypothetical protein G6F32_017336 [Rhizopus arrhizus]|nr:hypothetical protein G6F32_017336 [Rhizopus arrhizus]